MDSLSHTCKNNEFGREFGEQRLELQTGFKFRGQAGVFQRCQDCTHIALPELQAESYSFEMPRVECCGGRGDAS